MNEQKNGILPKFKIGDEVELIHDDNIAWLKKGRRFIVQRIQKNIIAPTQITYSYTDYINGQVRKPVVRPAFVVPERFLKLVEHHKGKVLIMVDEKDNNKIIARDLVTGKKAEAKRNPNDEWDFEKGAKLAFERLYPEKKIVFHSESSQSVKQGEKVNIEIPKDKPWTGKVICVVGNRIDCLQYFKTGKIYNVKNGILYTEYGYPWFTHHGPYKSVEEVINDFGPYLKFIEYKGEV